MKNIIIGISGIAGAGKTTVTQHLAQLLDATAVYWDDFDDISTSPDDYVAWDKSERLYEAWDYPALAATLDSLKHGNSLNHPALNHPLTPTKYIIFDAPLGRLHKQTGDYLDFWIHIDVPLDIALARRTIRDFTRDPRSVPELLEDLQYYLDHSRPLFLEDEYKRGSDFLADFVVDGTLSTEEQARKIKSHVGKP